MRLVEIIGRVSRVLCGLKCLVYIKCYYYYYCCYLNEDIKEGFGYLV